MYDIRIPCVVWFHGDLPPDLSGISDPIRISFALRTHVGEPSDLSEDRTTTGSTTATTSGPSPFAKDDFRLRWPGNDAINGAIRSLSVATQRTELAAARDLSCQGFSGGCQSGGDWETTAVYSVSGRGLCANCAVKSLGIQDMPAGEKATILRPVILPGN